MDLSRFCGWGEVAKARGIGRPFSRGQYTYATNGHICIRVPRLPDVPENEYAPNPEKLFAQAAARPTAWQGLPTFELETKTCDDCKGGGKLKECPWCKGHNTCKRCDSAMGYIPAKASDEKAIDCEECEGTGREELPGDIIVDGFAAKVKVSAIYLARIADLPNVQIAPHDKTLPVRIKFAGGEGLLMPMFR